MRQAHHLTVGFVRGEDACAHATDILGERHDEVLTNRVDGGVSDLCKLLTEIVEKDLRTVRQHGQRCVVTHSCRGLLALGRHRYDGAIDIFFAKTKLYFMAKQVGQTVVYLSARM